MHFFLTRTFSGFSKIAVGRIFFETKQNALISLLLLLLAGGCTQSENSAVLDDANTQKEGVNVGFLAPDFKLRTLSGADVALSDYRGKIVLINFWATWCGPCKAEMPSMQALYNHYPREDFEILAVSIDIDPRAPVRQFIKDFGFTFPVLLDDTFAVNDQYQIRVVPTSVVVDRKGVVQHRLLGAKDWNAPDSKLFLEKLIAAR